MPEINPRNSVSGTTPHTYIVLLNWNGWRDTIECVESLLRLTVTEYTIVICDNASADGSYEHLLAWLTERESSQHGSRRFFAEWTPNSGAAADADARIVLVQTGSNLGFAGGCNVGLRYGVERDDGEYFWLLNNDTVVDPGALAAQLAKMEAHPRTGITGSTLLFYDAPDVVQCCGGYGFNFWTARVRPAATAVSARQLPSEASVERALRYVSGASMFVRRAFLERVGYLNEQYFLYFEEIDWTTRASGKFDIGYCSASRILHKEGRSIGSSGRREERSARSERWLSRNRLLFTRTYFPLRLPITLLWTSGVALSRLLRGEGARAWTIFTSAWKGVFAPAKAVSYPSAGERKGV